MSDDVHTLLMSYAGVLLAFFTVVVGAAAVAIAARLKEWGSAKKITRRPRKKPTPPPIATK